MLKREMIKIIVLAEGMRLGERQIAEIMVVFPHRLVLMPLPQSKITGVAMVVVVPEDELAVVVVAEDEIMIMLVVVRLAEDEIVVVRMA